MKYIILFFILFTTYIQGQSSIVGNSGWCYITGNPNTIPELTFVENYPTRCKKAYNFSTKETWEYNSINHTWELNNNTPQLISIIDEDLVISSGNSINLNEFKKFKQITIIVNQNTDNILITNIDNPNNNFLLFLDGSLQTKFIDYTSTIAGTIIDLMFYTSLIENQRITIIN